MHYYRISGSAGGFVGSIVPGEEGGGGDLGGMAQN